MTKTVDSEQMLHSVASDHLQCLWPTISTLTCLFLFLKVNMVFSFSGIPFLHSTSDQFPKNQELHCADYVTKVLDIIKNIPEFSEEPHFLCNMCRMANKSPGNRLCTCVLPLLYSGIHFTNFCNLRKYWDRKK